MSSPDPNDTYSGLAQRPTMRPRVSTRFGLRLDFVDAAGRAVCLDLSETDLAALALDIAEAQAQRARERLSTL